MRSLIIQKNQTGRRLDKFLLKYLDKANSGFIYKMLRKKNITLNGKKADGSEKLNLGDEIKIFFSDDTFEKFCSEGQSLNVSSAEQINMPFLPDAAFFPKDGDIIYEDENVLFLNKPVGMLSQKAKKIDVSLNEYALSYLLSSGKISVQELHTFKPSVCNRLDRNTTGLITVGVSLKGTRALTLGFQKRTFDKYYLCIVSGKLEKKADISGFLKKNPYTNKVSVCQEQQNDYDYIETSYEPLAVLKACTVLKVKLITGKAHQIRAHLASVGHPVIGDVKYGEFSLNEQYRMKYGVKSQLLHSWQLSVPQTQNSEAVLSYLCGKTFVAEPPKIYEEICGGLLWQHGIQEG